MTSPIESDAMEKEVNELIEPSLFRQTEGLPNLELKIAVREATECEAALVKEIDLLEAAQKDESKLSEDDKAAVDQMLATEFTPPDRFWTVSAVLGRLREPMATPLPPNSTLLRAQQQQQTKKKKAGEKCKQIEKQKALLALDSNPEYRKEHPEPTTLLALWKRISSHRTAAVFRRPVNEREAPGYSERILFPIDMSLIRKMIVGRFICSYADLHQRIGLICHNCVKYNGRESDYAVVTREFEAYVDEVMVSVVTGSSRATTPKNAPLS